MDVSDRELLRLEAGQRPFRPAGRGAVAAGFGCAVVFYVIACLVGGSYGAAFFAIPFFFGFVSGVLAPERPYKTSFAALALALLFAILTFREGVVCTIMALPLLAPLTALGALVGSSLGGRVKSRRGQQGLLGLGLLVGAGWQLEEGLTDDPLRHPLHFATATQEIAAAPADVFSALTEHDLSVASRWPWFLRIGLPTPVRMVVDRPGPDGRLHFDMEHGTAFAKVTAWRAPERLSYAVTHYELHDLPFHITRLGRSPDYGFRKERVEDWLTIQSTTYELEPIAENRTLLRRSLVWRRHLAPDFYFGWMQQVVMERCQRRLLELIAERIPAREPEKSRVASSTAAAW